MHAPSDDPTTHPQPPVAIVTGGNRGTGRAITTELTHAGMEVWQLNRNTSGDPRDITCDLSQPADLHTAVQHILTRTGRLDALITNAVDRYYAPIAELDLDRWTTALTVNLTSTIALIQQTLPMLRRSRGTIVLMGSHAGSRFFEGGLPYCAPKAALKALSEILLLEERPHGVRTSLVSPGAIANEDGDTSPLKITTGSVARVVRDLITNPSDIAVAEIELRPAALGPPAVTGLDRLQSV
ncbi:SDR family NAD(P)-dependent oxidoreductase [Streptomyces sp. NPDC088258]|uniref:SDR family NAD(P)-dependent oxidoreductase n=1 Tax=Streptomyces sp. NPDC088258 TaxID=3365849 RepID=UPI0038086FD4